MKIIENRKIFFAVSVVLICIGLAAMALNANAGRGALNWDVEFTGGTSRFSQRSAVSYPVAVLL